MRDLVGERGIAPQAESKHQMYVHPLQTQSANVLTCIQLASHS
jgi:hypothetical protein